MDRPELNRSDRSKAGSDSANTPLPPSLRPRALTFETSNDEYRATEAIEEMAIGALVHGGTVRTPTAADAIVDRKLRKKVLTLDTVTPKLAAGQHRLSRQQRRVRVTKSAAIPRIDLRAEESNLKYEALAPLGELWKDYAASLLGSDEDKAVDVDKLAERVMRMDFHGAEIEVVQARDPTLVGKRGIVYQETSHTIRIVSARDQKFTVPKRFTTFELCAGATAFEISGSTIELRSSERSVRKFKKKHIQRV